MSSIRKIGFEKHPKVEDTFDGGWGSTRIEIAKEELVEVINLNLDSAIQPDIKKFCALFVGKNVFKYSQEITSS